MSRVGVSVDLDRAAQSDPLAREVRRRVLAATARPRVQQQFVRMWGTVVIVRRPAPDVATNEHPEADGPPEPPLERSPELTLRFDYGSLVIHCGRVGRPDVTLFGADDDILSLGGGATEAPLERALLGSMSVYLRALRAIQPRGGSDGGLQIFGRTAHPLFVARLGLVLSP